MITETIYIPLLDEEIDISRPTQGVPQGGSVYLVLPTPTYSAEIETWKFPPGTVVTCVDKKGADGSIKIASELHY